MTLSEFEEIVAQLIDELPEEYRRQLDNVGIVVEAWPSNFDLQSIRAQHGTLLFGLYQGVPKTKRGAHYSWLPDKITLFAGPLIAISKDLEDAKKNIRKTLVHEIGHHFGMNEEHIRRIEREQKSA